jgi:hypothetical protein
LQQRNEVTVHARFSSVRHIPARIVAVAAAATLVFSAVLLTPAAVAFAAAPASISGTVTSVAEPGGVAGVDVQVSRNGSFQDDATTGASGEYTVGNLPAGTYTIQFNNTRNAHVAAYGQQWWDDQLSVDDATTFAVTAGQAVVGKDAVLHPVTTISGTVTADGAPGVGVAGVSYELCSQASCLFGGPTDASGVYDFPDAVPGTYTLQILPPDPYIAQTVSSFTVSEGDADTHDVTLEEGAGITGTLSVAGNPGVDMSNAIVDVFHAFPAGGFVTGTNVNGDGTYSIGQLPPGNYTVEFVEDGFIDQWWDDEPTAAASDSFTLTAGETLPDIDASLVTTPAGATISGTVTGSDTGGVGLNGISVSLLTTAGAFLGSFPTDASGNFTLTGVAPGSYQLEFTADDQTYLDQWWNNKTTESSGTKIIITGPQAVTGIDVVMQKSAAISGTVTADGAPLAGVDVFAWPTGAGNGEFDETDADGNYTILDLPAGSYNLEFDPPGATPYAIQWWNDKPVEDAGDPVTVTAGQAIAGKDAVLGDAATIAGTVTGADAPGVGIGGATVSAWDDASGYEVGQATTNPDGTYSIRTLPAGSYHLEITPPNRSRYASQWWNNKATADLSDVIALTGGQVMSGTNVVLSLNLTSATPSISGTTTVGSVLTATTGTWGPAPVQFGYQWIRGGVPIAGATDATYTPTNDDAGQRLTVTVTGSKAGYATVAKTSSSKTITGGILSPTPIPTISGDATLGSTLTANAGTWGPAPVALGYQWQRDGVTISGARSATYTLTAADLGTTIEVVVTGSKTSFTSVPETSASTATVVGSLNPTPTPSITGDASVGSTLTAVAGTWGPVPVALSYAWTRDGTVIAGATDSTYTLTNDDAGAIIAVEVTGSEPNYTSVTTTGPATSVVTGGSIIAAVPTVTGTFTVGKTLTAIAGAWTPADVAFGYQWERDGTAIAGATGVTYTLVAADAKHSVTVTVTGSKTGFTDEPAASVGQTVAAAHTATPPVSTPPASAPTNSSDESNGSAAAASGTTASSSDSGSTATPVPTPSSGDSTPSPAPSASSNPQHAATPAIASSDGGVSPWLIVGIVVVVILLLLGGFVFLRRRLGQ